MATKIHYSTVRKAIENKLKFFSVEELQNDCKRVLKDLKQYPKENKWQINYYSKFWELLAEY